VQGPEDDEPRGKVDAVSLLYIFGGVPVIVLYLVVLFALARSCNAPA
jgi:hypothetical protein